ncbi:MAG: ATP-binding cassette domain-containing protein [Pseudomonadota bacterium]
MADTGLQLRDVRIATGGRRLIDGLSAHVLPGDVLSVMGPSGTGKSTLLAAITGTLQPAFTLTGEIFLNGRDLRPLRPQHRDVGILFQDHLLFPHLSVSENLAFGLHPKTKDRKTRIAEALADIDLAEFADRDPATLSGGQRARVALMRMLLAAPKALLLDEPFSRLDAALRDKMREMVFTRARDLGLPVLMVTHDLADADAAGGQVIELG